MADSHPLDWLVSTGFLSQLDDPQISPEAVQPWWAITM